MQQTYGLTFRCWRDDGLVTLADLLMSLGRTIEGNRWRLVVEELPSPRYQEICDTADRSLMETGQLIALLGDDAQLIDGELAAYDADGACCDLTIRALDSTWWDIETTRQEVLDQVSRFYPDAEILHSRSPDED
ncbi:hypothetical protein AB0B89_11030 [Sphaerisporangium sp. NPDC049002]|uniref:hypothetical protein n=1 Tax=Sphaerisporangium sp. NPDC049002 TaxID=3155392 RepID=UPI0033DE54CF